MPVSAESLTVYTSRKEHLVKDVFKQYQKETGIEVKYKTGKAGALIQQLKGEASNPKADLFMTVDAGNLWFAKSQNLFETVDSKLLLANIPSHLRDRDNKWFGLSMRARVTVVNKTKLASLKDITYEGLADSKWNKKLCLRTSKKVYNQSLVAMLIKEHGYKEAKKIVKGWVSNNVEIFSNDTNALKAVASGRCEVAIVNTYYFGRLVKKNPNISLKILWPNQNTTGAHVNVSGAGVVKGTKNKKQAIKFLEWLSSKKAQAHFAQVNMEYPVLKGSHQAPIVKAWGNFKSNEKFNLSDAGELQKQAVRLMHEAQYR